MIVNETKQNMKDIKFIADCRGGSGILLIMCRIVMVLCGIYLIAVDIKLLDTELRNEALVYITLGVILIGYAFFIRFVKRLVVCKKYDFVEKRRYFFADNEVTVIEITDGKKIESTYSYSKVTRVFEGNKAIYLEVLDEDENTHIFPIHDETYKKGDKDALINMLAEQ